MLTAVSLISLPPVFLSSRYFGASIKKFQQQVQEELGATTTKAEEVISQIKTVRSFNGEALEVVNYEKKVQRVRDRAIAAGMRGAYLDGSVHVAANAGLLAILAVGGNMVGVGGGGGGEISPGDLASFLMYEAINNPPPPNPANTWLPRYSLFVAGNTASLSTVYGSIQKTRGAAGRIFEIIDREPAIGGGAGGAGPSHKESRVAVGVQFEQVGFRYPAREDFVVLDGMDLELPAGTHTAIVGHSGCGKSTVASLLLRLYDVTSGTVKVGGKDVKDLPTDELRDMIAVVQQEPVLFGGSIRENIAYGRSDASEEDVLVAARAAKVTDFVETFPEGLDTIVGERGVRLSGGQKQRVAVARVLLRQAPVVIFDEATSALDAESEFAVTKAIESLVRDRTVVSIAHRLSTIRMADRVAVLEGGKVVEIIEDVGALDEEMLRGRGDSPFANLIRRQLSKEPSN